MKLKAILKGIALLPFAEAVMEKPTGNAGIHLVPGKQLHFYSNL